MIVDALIDAALDCVKTLPFLFLAFIIIEALEHYSTHFINKTLADTSKVGPLLGAMFGCIPQCGFSVAAANLYSGGIITLGTLLAIFLSTSDEAILILMSNPGSGTIIWKLIAGKVCIGILAGYAIDFVYRKKKEEKHISDMCRTCGCSDSKGIFAPAVVHTFRILWYLFLFTFLLNLLLEGLGAERLALILRKDSALQPFLTALLGLIPNCASSVMVTELYLAGGISFGAAMSGLCAGSGVGLAVLFRTNHPMRENFKILGLLYGISVIAGIVIQVFF